MAISQSEPLAPQTYLVPNVGGATIAVNNLGTAGVQVVPADQGRKSITFANPNINGAVNILVFQMTDISGNSLAGTTFAAPGGGWPLVPGGVITFTGDCQGAWGAVAASGTTNGLTAISSRS